MTPDAYLERVRALIPALRQRAPHMEQLRRLPDATLKEFQEAGLFRALQPERYGGYELDPSVFYQAVMDIGTVCGSSAWVLGVLGVHNWQLALFPEQAQRGSAGTTIRVSSSPPPWPLQAPSHASTEGSSCTAAGRSPAAATFANGPSWVGSCRRVVPVSP